MSCGSIGRYGTPQSRSSIPVPAAAARFSMSSKPFLMASWWDPEKAV